MKTAGTKRVPARAKSAETAVIPRPLPGNPVSLETGVSPKSGETIRGPGRGFVHLGP
jgi:hypothetical protein